MKLNVIGDVYGTTGYAVHTRSLANALAKYHDVRLLTFVPQQWQLQVTDEENLMMKKADSQDRMNIIITMPNMWSTYADKENNVGFLVWEGDRIPKDWIRHVLNPRIKQVWVPSQHTKDAITNAIGMETDEYPDKIKIVPHGVVVEKFPVKEEPKEFTFLCNKGFRSDHDRGGIQYALKAFGEEFKPGEAKLFIKLNPSYAMNPQEFAKYVDTVNPKNREDITVTWDAIPYENLHMIYERGTVFLNPTMAEAFSIPCIEAMSCGLPVITTGYGGQMDYVTYENGWIVNFDLKEVKHEVQYEGVMWAVPRIDSLRRAMRMAYEDSEGRKKRRENARKTALKYDWDQSAIIATNALRLL